MVIGVDNMKIEPGCMAIVINSHMGHNGKIVIVGDFIGYIENWLGDDHWSIDITLAGTYGRSKNSIRECQLMRIDGFKEEAIQKSKELSHG